MNRLLERLSVGPHGFVVLLGAAALFVAVVVTVLVPEPHAGKQMMEVVGCHG